MFSDPFGLCPVWLDGVPCEDMIKGGMVPANTNMASGVGGAEFGPTRSGGTKDHNGFDNKADYGAPVYAPADGTLSTNRSTFGGRGVTLDLGNDSKIEALHLSAWPRELMGQTSIQVKAGDVIGYVGRSGNLAKAKAETHTHIMTFSKGVLCNPRNFLGATQGACQ